MDDNHKKSELIEFKKEERRKMLILLFSMNECHLKGKRLNEIWKCVDEPCDLSTKLITSIRISHFLRHHFCLGLFLYLKVTISNTKSNSITLELNFNTKMNKKSKKNSEHVEKQKKLN